MSTLKIPQRAKYKKRVGAFSGIDVKHDQSVVDFSSATQCYNFDITSGALRDGYGIAEHALVPKAADRYFVYRYYNNEAGAYVDQYIYRLPSSGYYRVYDSYTGAERYLTGKNIPASAHMINYRLNSEDVLLISSEGNKLMYWDGTRVNDCENTPMISSMALHYERLFVTSREDPTKVFFSDDLDPTNFSIGASEGGFIELLDERGEMNMVMSFAGYVYIFRDHGITRVTAYADQAEFSVNNLFVSAGRIYPESIARCGDRIMFVASDGVFAFDGYSCVRILSALDGLIAGGAVKASAFFDGKYYLSCRMNFSGDDVVGCETGEYAANGLLVYDIATGAYSISRGLDIDFMNAVTYDGEDLFVAHDSAGMGVVTRCGKRFDAPLPKKWQSPSSDFGSFERKKSVREVHIDSTVPLTLTVECDGRARTAAVDKGRRVVRPHIGGKSVAVSVETTGTGCNIAPFTVVYS